MNPASSVPSTFFSQSFVKHLNNFSKVGMVASAIITAIGVILYAYGAGIAFNLLAFGATSFIVSSAGLYKTRRIFLPGSPPIFVNGALPFASIPSTSSTSSNTNLRLGYLKEWVLKFYANELFHLIVLGIKEDALYGIPRQAIDVSLPSVEGNSLAQEEMITVKIGDEACQYPKPFLEMIPIFRPYFQTTWADNACSTSSNQMVIQLSELFYIPHKFLKKLELLFKGELEEDLEIGQEDVEFLGIGFFFKYRDLIGSFCDFQDLIQTGHQSIPPDQLKIFEKWIPYAEYAPSEKCGYHSIDSNYLILPQSLQKSFTAIINLLKENISRLSEDQIHETPLNMLELFRSLDKYRIDNFEKCFIVNCVLNEYFSFLNQGTQKNSSAWKQLETLFSSSDPSWTRYATIVQLPSTFPFLELPLLLQNLPEIRWLSIAFFDKKPDLSQWIPSWSPHAKNLQVFKLSGIDGLSRWNANASLNNFFKSALPQVEIFDFD